MKGDDLIMLPRTFEEALDFSKQILEKSKDPEGVRMAERESEWIVLYAFRKVSGRGRTFSKADLYTRVMENFPEAAGRTVIDWAYRRQEGEPLAYILGYQSFLNHEYEVGPGVLIPRPETEKLVFEILSFYQSGPRANPIVGLEMGFGSGCVAIELCKAFSGLRMVATDISEAAMVFATKNRERILSEPLRDKLRLTKVEPKEPLKNIVFSDACNAPFAPPFDFIVSNPPYLKDASECQPGVLKYEPREALFSPVEREPLFFYKRIATDAAELLKPDGMIFCEISELRLRETQAVFEKAGYITQIRLDLANRPRYIFASLKDFIKKSDWVH